MTAGWTGAASTGVGCAAFAACCANGFCGTFAITACGCCVCTTGAATDTRTGRGTSLAYSSGGISPSSRPRGAAAAAAAGGCEGIGACGGTPCPVAAMCACKPANSRYPFPHFGHANSPGRAGGGVACWKGLGGSPWEVLSSRCAKDGNVLGSTATASFFAKTFKLIPSEFHAAVSSSYPSRSRFAR